MKLTFLWIILLFGNTLALAQEIPMFSQKLTDAVIYNPSFAGLDGGSVTLAHRSALSRVEGSGKTNYLSCNLPLSYNNFGVGLNLYNETINFLNNTFVSGAFAYHIDLGDDQLLSMGVSAEYNIIRVDMDDIVGDPSDEMLALIASGNYNKMDFSAGLNYQHRYFKIGVSTNRLATAFGGDKMGNLLVQYYTAIGSLMFPVRKGEDLVEPMLTYRKYSKISHSWDIGCYYTFKDLVLLGVLARFGGSNTFSTERNNGPEIINVTCGLKLMKKLQMGYGVDIPFTNSAPLGPSHELTLSYEFIDINGQRFGDKSPSTYNGNLKRKKRKR